MSLDTIEIDLREFVAQAPEPDAIRTAPRQTRPVRPAIENCDQLRSLDEAFDPSRAAPIEDCLTGEIPEDDLEWAAAIGRRHIARSREGAMFVRLAEDVFVIPVAGGQILHDDRHLADINPEQARGFSEHTWNLVVSGSEDQLLLCEVEDQIYEHFSLRFGDLIYFNTVNRHALSRKSPLDTVVIVQVDGYESHERDAAVARLREVLATRASYELV